VKSEQAELSGGKGGGDGGGCGEGGGDATGGGGDGGGGGGEGLGGGGGAGDVTKDVVPEHTESMHFCRMTNKVVPKVFWNAGTYEHSPHGLGPSSLLPTKVPLT